MAFNPNAITNADPFGAFLSGDVIGREQNRADDQLSMMLANERRQQDQFDWAKTLRGDQETISREKAMMDSIKRAQESLALGGMRALQPLQIEAAQRENRMGGLNEQAAALTTMPSAQLSAATSNQQLQTLPQRSALELDTLQAALTGRNLGNSAIATGIQQGWQDRFLQPIGTTPTGNLLVSGPNGQPMEMTIDQVIQARQANAAASLGIPIEQVQQFLQSQFSGGSAGGQNQGFNIGDWGTGGMPSAAPAPPAANPLLVAPPAMRPTVQDAAARANQLYQVP